MITIEIPPSILIEPEIVERAVAVALNHQAVEDDADLTVVLTDDEQLQDLNREFRDIDAPTDVLSFPASESDPETGRRYLGDVLISVQRAEEQAAAGGHPLEAELQLLVVHGVLHLLGHDHAEDKDKLRMWAAQAQILARLGLANIKISE
ncbi:MAG: rRNA maturation RNase YbeY [Chloroflexi bacterium]|nr:rRNA maturation RNase YbeY [Chloroflexota bacterium]